MWPLDMDGSYELRPLEVLYSLNFFFLPPGVRDRLTCVPFLNNNDPERLRAHKLHKL
jgi:hypothetical protein